MLRILATSALGVLSTTLIAGAAWSAEITLHGSSTVTNTLMLPHKAEIEAESGHKLTIVGNGSSRGLLDLLGGKADLGMISAPLATTIVKVVAQMPQGIGIAIAAMVDGKNTVSLETDEVIAQPLILASLGDPGADAQEVINAARKVSGF